jgi:hypothetical protein
MESKNADKIIDVLKELVKSAIIQGFTKTSFLVRDHIRYIKKIQSANNPEMHVIYTAKKLFQMTRPTLKRLKKYMLNIRMNS